MDDAGSSPVRPKNIYRLPDGKSTYTDEATVEIEKGNQGDTIVLDFSKAFDEVSHTLLIHK